MDHSTLAGMSSASSTRVVDVLVPVALNQAYSYRVPRGMELKPGDLVCVPLGPREVIAVVWADNANPDPRLHKRLKDVGEKLDVPPLKQELRALVDWVANYTLSARGMVLRMTLRMGEHLGPERMRMGVRLIGEPPRRMTASQEASLDAWMIKTYLACWKPAAQAADADPYVARVRLKFKPDGSLLKPPKLVNPPSDPAQKPQARSVLQAVSMRPFTDAGSISLIL